MDQAGETILRLRNEKRALELQIGEVTAHRDRLRDMLNDIRGMVLIRDSNTDLDVQILRRIEDGVIEKPKGVCTHNCLDKDYSTGHTLCMKDLPCPDHGVEKPKDATPKALLCAWCGVIDEEVSMRSAYGQNVCGLCITEREG